VDHRRAAPGRSIASVYSPYMHPGVGDYAEASGAVRKSHAAIAALHVSQSSAFSAWLLTAW